MRPSLLISFLISSFAAAATTKSKSASTLKSSSVTKSTSKAVTTASPTATALPYGPGQCDYFPVIYAYTSRQLTLDLGGGIGYTGPRDCYDPYYDYTCVIVTDNYWACASEGLYHCETASEGAANGKVCTWKSSLHLFNFTFDCCTLTVLLLGYTGGSIGGTGPDCCANWPEWSCIGFTDNVSYCLQIANYTEPASTTTTATTFLATSTTATLPTVTACAANYAQCKCFPHTYQLFIIS
jgi:hypothetical protein